MSDSPEIYEVLELRQQLAAMTEMRDWQDTRLVSLEQELNDRDTVPRTRYNACNQDWLDAEAKLKTVQTNARQEIERLKGDCAAWEQGFQNIEHIIAHRKWIRSKQALAGTQEGV